MDRGLIVYAPFVFSNLEGQKMRPACILSTAAFNAGPDLVVAMVTSRRRLVDKPGLGDVVLRDWQQVGLRLPSVLRVGRVQGIERRLVTLRLGPLTRYDAAAADEALREVLGLA